MLLPSAEYLLIGAVLVLYLYDSAVLLYDNEAVLYPSRGNRWRVLFASDAFQWKGKGVLLPNPFAPHRPLYRITWSMGEESTPENEVEEPNHLFGWLAVQVGFMAFALFILLPAGLFARHRDAFMLAAIVSFYGAATSALSYIWIQRRQLRCSGAAFVRLAFESLTCPPFALNLVRHLSLAHELPFDLENAARALQCDADWAETRQALITRLENELMWSDGRPESVAKLNRLVARLTTNRNTGEQSLC